MASNLSRRAALRATGAAAASLGTGLVIAACGREQGNSSLTSSQAAATTTTTVPTAPPAAVKVTQPVTGIEMTPGYARSIAQMAYLWGWPLVNMHNRRVSVTQALEPGHLNGVLPVAPQGRLSMLSDYIKPDQTFIACPNQDVAYGLAYLALDEQPVIVQVPDFGDRFWVYAMYDGRSDQFGQLGKAYNTKPGFYMLVGPKWNGDKPNGVQDIIRASTELGGVVPRIFLDDTPEDRAAIQPVLNQIGVYPVGEFDGKMKITDWAKLPDIPAPPTPDGAETKWVVPEKFFDADQFGAVLAAVPPLPGEEALYAQYRSMLDSADKNSNLKKVLVDAAVASEADVIAPFFQWVHNGVPAGNGWNRSVNNAQFGVDYFNRTATAKSNMLENRPTETQYFYSDNDITGAQLQGAKTYKLTFPAGQEPPVDGFWSVTLYNDKHLFATNPLNRYSLGTKSKDLKRNSDGSLTLYAGAKSPGPENDSNWLPAPGGPFSLFIRAYWGKAPIIDGSWKPPAIEMF
ncbi:DUF1254 domain-containing protein [Mycolicibacterium sp. Dal123E01]|uniref:DUF1254 domain-containing protein n=1 Tax=Mycolicibacterium sp. Dal123E01 TaxID=3457578 RepID=UPI00403E90B1